MSPGPQKPGVIFARPHAVSALKPKNALEQNELAYPHGTVSENPPSGSSRIEIDLQKHGNKTVASPRQLQGSLDEFFRRFALDAVFPVKSLGDGEDDA